jgi:hypothetical protein
MGSSGVDKTAAHAWLEALAKEFRALGHLALVIESNGFDFVVKYNGATARFFQPAEPDRVETSLVDWRGHRADQPYRVDELPPIQGQVARTVEDLQKAGQQAP